MSTEQEAFKAMQRARTKLERAKRQRQAAMDRVALKHDDKVREAGVELAAAKELWETFGG
jgi:hypothetical protein